MSNTILEKKKQSISKYKAPGKFKVIICNDDVTTVEFVISLLMMVFKHDQETAAKITYQIHQEGSAVAAVYAYEIAEQKALDATNIARNNGFPLIVKVEPE